MVHEQVGGGGQIGDRIRAFRGHASPQPLPDRLTAHAEEAGRLGLAQSPHRECAGEGLPCALPVEAFGEGVEPRAFVLVRSEYLLGRLFRPELPKDHARGHVSASHPVECPRKPLSEFVTVFRDISGKPPEQRRTLAIQLSRRSPDRRTSSFASDPAT